MAKGVGSYVRAMWRYGRWVLLAVVLGLVALTIARMPHVLNEQKSAAVVEEIQAAHLTMADVDGEHLPPPPDPAQADATVAGIDANQNGIRDDVELAIFKKYPDNMQLRAAALQYAMTEQMFLTKVFSTETWKAVAEENGRANLCLAHDTHADASSVEDWIDGLLFNTQQRISARDRAFENITSHGDAAGVACDIELAN